MDAVKSNQELLAVKLKMQKMDCFFKPLLRGTNNPLLQVILARFLWRRRSEPTPFVTSSGHGIAQCRTGWPAFVISQYLSVLSLTYPETERRL